MEFFGFPLILVPAVVLGRVLVRAGLSSTGVTAGLWILTAAIVAALGAAAGSIGVPAFILLWPIALALVGLAAWLIVRPDPTAAWTSLAAATLIMALGVIGVLTSTREFHAPQWMIAGFGAAALYFSDSYLREHGR